MILAKERRARPRTPGWSISGGSAASDGELRQQIRARLSGPCIVCRRAIEPTEVERQVEGVGVFLYAHEACYKLWREESVAGRVAKERIEEP